jgi:NADH:ubiquinone oxidoreductase subunit C
MTTFMPSRDLAPRLDERWGGSVRAEEGCLRVDADVLHEVATYLRDTTGLNFDNCDMLTAADYPDCIELVYRLVSLPHNRFVVLKVCLNRQEPVAPSLISVYRSAEFQEREVFDLFGVRFTGHPFLRRIMLWEGFAGHPLRKDYGHGA